VWGMSTILLIYPEDIQPRDIADWAPYTLNSRNTLALIVQNARTFFLYTIHSAHYTVSGSWNINITQVQTVSSHS